MFLNAVVFLDLFDITSRVNDDHGTILDTHAVLDHYLVGDTCAVFDTYAVTDVDTVTDHGLSSALQRLAAAERGNYHCNYNADDAIEARLVTSTAMSLFSLVVVHNVIF